jgi:peptidoglycan/LPS O-acetylase OafA/YrhL
MSFSMYLVQGPVMRLLEGPTGVLGGMIGRDSSGGRMVGWAMETAVIVIPAVVWAADVFCRAVERPVVAWARRLEAWGTGTPLGGGRAGTHTP